MEVQGEHIGRPPFAYLNRPISVIVKFLICFDNGVDISVEIHQLLVSIGRPCINNLRMRVHFI
jgi:hypothetical protein